MPIVTVTAPPVAPPVTSSSTDGYLTVTVDGTNGGVLLQADFSSLPTVPRKVRFVRDTIDGEGPVRSGHDAWAPGGYAIAYDAEAPLGVVSTWRAIPIYGNAGIYTDGVASASASVIPPDLDTYQDFWLKSISNPTLSIRLRSTIPNPEFNLAGSDALVDIPGSELQAGSWNVPKRQPVTYTFKTATAAERNAVLAVLRAGPVLVQCLRLYDISDGYFLMGSVKESYAVGAFDPRRHIEVTFKPVSRPPTEGAPLYVPGRSYADFDAAFLSYAQEDAAFPSYAAMAGS